VKLSNLKIPLFLGQLIAIKISEIKKNRLKIIEKKKKNQEQEVKKRNC